MISSLVDVFPLSERGSTILCVCKYSFYVHMPLSYIDFFEEKREEAKGIDIQKDRDRVRQEREKKRLRDRQREIQRKRQTKKQIYR